MFIASMKINPALYYSNEKIINALYEASKDREVQIWINDLRGKRPDSVNFVGDVLAFIKQGMTSMHISVERWKDPMKLRTGMTKAELDSLRKGWDLILDIDCKDLGVSKVTAELIMEALKFHDVENISIKFSGGSGFHIGVPFECFPARFKGQNIVLLFPEIVRKIASYIKEMIKPHLAERILKIKKEDQLKELGASLENFDPFKIVDIDTVLISSRHMFRAPYSLNEKTWLVSLPIKNVKTFNIEDANPKIVKPKLNFLDIKNPIEDETKLLLVQAYEWASKEESKKPQLANLPKVKKRISEENFPPCIKKILSGIREDGRKRALFVLVNFLLNIGWDIVSVEALVNEWNKKNYEPLKEGYIRTQINWYKRQQRALLPPNCINEMYYKSIGICKPDSFCKQIKNPVNYAIKKSRTKKRSS